MVGQGNGGMYRSAAVDGVWDCVWDGVWDCRCGYYEDGCIAGWEVGGAAVHCVAPPWLFGVLFGSVGEVSACGLFLF